MAEQLSLFEKDVLDTFQMYVLTQLVPFGDLRTMRAEFEFHQSRDNWQEVDGKTWDDVGKAFAFLDTLGEVKLLDNTLRRIPNVGD